MLLNSGLREIELYEMGEGRCDEQAERIEAVGQRKHGAQIATLTKEVSHLLTNDLGLSIYSKFLHSIISSHVSQGDQQRSGCKLEYLFNPGLWSIDA